MEVVGRYWGFDSLRPVQEDAVRAALQGRDSLVVMPTGGGKSLCYQVPPLLTARLGVVVSPLIALMKDQVDGLVLAGYPAAALHSNLSPEESRDAERRLASGELRLLLIAPERLLAGGMLDRLSRLGVGSFSIDEAHCISQWGHDFRPEYRRLAELRERFPGAAVHAFTATATRRVQEDIVEQLRLRDPALLIGTFDRPNLTYRILPRVRIEEQTAEAIRRHAAGENAGAAIVYSISRRDTETLAGALGALGIQAEAYHAGLPAGERRRIQDDFAQERLDVVVATVAFGMGIDRSNVRLVVHAAMPKSVEAYQQETGRAGRDGLPAECLLLHSGADAPKWRRIMEESAAESGASEESLRTGMELLERMHRFAAGAACRHRALSEYFGQEYRPPEGAAGCGACDVCLGDLQSVPDSTTIARKIVSCVARCGQGFGAAHIADVLRGSSTQRVKDRRHDQLSTFGLMRGVPKALIAGYINQLVDLGLLERAGTEFPIVVLSETSVELLRGRRGASLLEPKRELAAAGRVRGEGRRADERPLEPEEAALFEALRGLRLSIARERNLPPYVVFTDATLRDMARLRPTAVDAMRGVRGVGERKKADLGPRFAAFIHEYCGKHGLRPAADSAPAAADRGPEGRGSQSAYFALFRQGLSVEGAARRLGHKASTAGGYLAEFVEHEKPASIDPWVDQETYRLIAQTAANLGAERFKPIFDHLGGRVDYVQIRVVMTHLRVMHE
jgi:ATP-dependent DNA helicase RecQ